MSALIEEAITEQWGSRCPDFDAGCPCCQAWAEYDGILTAAEQEQARVAAWLRGEAAWMAQSDGQLIRDLAIAIEAGDMET